MRGVSAKLVGYQSCYRERIDAIETRVVTFPEGHCDHISIRKLEWQRLSSLYQTAFEPGTLECSAWMIACENETPGTPEFAAFLRAMFRQCINMYYEMEMPLNRRRANDNGSYFKPDEGRFRVISNPVETNDVGQLKPIWIKATTLDE